MSDGSAEPRPVSSSDLHFEARPARPASFSEPSSASSSAPTAPRILLVEDNLLVLQSLALGLSDRGIEVSIAEGGGCALQALIAADAKFDLVLTDLNMPMVSGRDILRAVQQSGTGLPVYVMSGFLTEREAGELEELGAAGILSKPVDLADLADFIIQVARAKRA